MQSKYVGLVAGISLFTGALLFVRHQERCSVRTSSTSLASESAETRARMHAMHPLRPSTAVGDTLDLDDVMARSHFAFEPLRDTYVGGDATYSVRVTGQTVEISPDDPAAKDPNHTAAPPLRLEATSLWRTDDAASQRGELARDAKGALTAHVNEGTTETIANTPAGLEQSWTFDHQPQGKGDLVVSIPVSGEEFVAQTDSGIHFTDATSGLGLLYGQARWVDATGRSTQVAVQYTNNRIEIVVPSDVVNEAAYPAVLDPTVGAEYSVDAPILAPAPDTQRAPAIGHPGTFNLEYTVVWQDRRRSIGMRNDIYRATVDRNGRVLDAVGVLVTPLTEDTDHLTPDIYDNVIIYTAVDDRGLYGVYAKDLLSTNPAKEIVRPDAASVTDCSVPRISGIYDTHVGTVYGIVWRERPRAGGNGKVVAKTITASLNDRPVAAVTVSPINVLNDAGFPAIAAQASINGPRFITVWSDNASGAYNIRGQLLASDGSLDSIPIVVTNQTTYVDSHPSVATFGGINAPYDGFAVSWDRTVPITSRWQVESTHVYAAYVSGGGTPGASVQLSNGWFVERSPGVAGYGAHAGIANTEALVTWVDTNDPSAVHGTRVTVTGPSWNPTLTAYDTAQFKFPASADSSVSIAAHSDPYGGYFVVWGDYRNGPYADIYGGNLPFTTPAFTSSVGVLSSYLISASANAETAPSIAWCGSRYLAVWRDSRNQEANDFDIYGVLLSSTGAPVGSSFAISTAAAAQDAPVVTCAKGAGTFLVAWTDQRNGNSDIYGTQVTTAGAVTSPSGLPLATSTTTESYPALASDNIGHLWMTYKADPGGIWGTELGATGNVVVAPVQLVADGTNADIDFDAATGKFLIVYQWFQAATKSYDILAVPMTVAGVLGSPFAVEQSSATQRYPTVRFDASGGTAMVAYEDDRNLSLTRTDIYGRRVTTGGTVGSATALATSASNEYRPRLATRSGSLQELTYWSTDANSPAEYDVSGVSLNAGAVTTSFAVSATAGVREMTPGIACSAATTCVAPYRSYDPRDSTTGADRIKARVLSY